MNTEIQLARRSRGQTTANVIDQSPVLVVLKDIPGPDGLPLMHTPWRLFLGDRRIAGGETDDQGRVVVMRHLEAGKVYRLEYPGRSLNILKTDWEDVTTERGMQQRLAALGYYAGARDGQQSGIGREALMHFQRDQNLPVDGEYAANTQTRLSEVFGA